MNAGPAARRRRLRVAVLATAAVAGCRPTPAPPLDGADPAPLTLPVDTLLRALATGGTAADDAAVRALMVSLTPELLQRQLRARDADGRTPLHFAAAAPRLLDVAGALLKAGAEAGALDTAGLSPLGAAARTGNVAGIALLAEHGASIGTRTHAGQTPLHLAAREPHPVAIRWLLAHGAELATRDGAGCRALDLALDAPGLAHAPDSTRRQVVTMLGGATRDLARARRRPARLADPHDDAPAAADPPRCAATTARR